MGRGRWSGRSRDLDRTVAFYGRLGFTVEFRQDAPDGYLILLRGTVELHFFGHPDGDPYTSSFMCFVRVADVDAVYAAWQPAGLPTAGIPRLTAPNTRPWGVREFALVDPDGTLLRVGRALD